MSGIGQWNQIRDNSVVFEHNGIDSILERNGFVKVHGCDIRYFNNVWDSPKVNSKQIDEILKYIKLQLDYMGVGCVCINGKIVHYNKIQQMDDIAFNKLFEIWIF